MECCKLMFAAEIEKKEGRISIAHALQKNSVDVTFKERKGERFSIRFPLHQNFYNRHRVLKIALSMCTHDDRDFSGCKRHGMQSDATAIRDRKLF